MVSPDNRVMHAATHAKTLGLTGADEAIPVAAAPAPSYLRKMLPAWPWGRLAAARAELEGARAQIATLKHEIGLHVDAREELNTTHAAELVRLEAQGESRLNL